MSFKHNGSYVNIFKDKDVLTKTLSLTNLNDVQSKVIEVIYKDVSDIVLYQNLLSNINFPFEKLYDIKQIENEITSKQRYINSPNVDDLLTILFKDINNLNEEYIFTIFKDVLKIWRKIHTAKDKKVLVDFNLRNFVYDGKNNLVLIDLFPPLIASRMTKTNYHGVNSQISLWLDSDVSICSLICYFLQPLIMQNKNSNNLSDVAKRFLDEIFEIVFVDLKTDFNIVINSSKSKKHVFIERLELLHKACNRNSLNDYANDFLNTNLPKNLHEGGKDKCNFQ